MSQPSSKPLVVFTHTPFRTHSPGKVAPSGVSVHVAEAGQQLYDALIASLRAWDVAIREGQPAQVLYDRLAADVAEQGRKMVDLVHWDEMTERDVESALQMWSSYILTWHVIRSALHEPRGPSSIDISRQACGVVSLPENFSLPSVFQSFQAARTHDPHGDLPESEAALPTGRGTGSGDGVSTFTTSGLSAILRQSQAAIERMDRMALHRLQSRARETS